ncbi:MAG TPA: histidinol dehydrogenase [Vicinamibacterales bacterium]|nr:histidinol dehydrogenase [Vicinamibacterales bacterium]
MNLRQMRIINSTDTKAVAALLDRRPGSNPSLDRAVARIVTRVRERGDEALGVFARRFDRLEGAIEVSRREIAASASEVRPEVRKAIATAARHVAAVARKQVPREWSVSPVAGVTIRQRVLPLDRVGCYVPGGRYPLPSSLLMTAIPARVAGVPEIVAVCPRPDATVLYAALEAGVTRFFRVGGAHAVAALAYGTASVPRVDKIVGPGNAWVAAAKARVSAACAIDFFAGPSEIAVVSSAGRPAWIAADLIAQAEHDPEARAILITPSKRLARRVGEEIRRQMPRAGPARVALARNGGIVLTRTLDEAVALSQRLAPEHLVCDTRALAARLTRAGTVFVGQYSAQASGDYVTGSNHVLPTSGAAAARGGLSAADFVRTATLQEITAAGLRRIGPAGITLALAEGLQAHAASMAMRLDTRRGRRERGAVR